MERGTQRVEEFELGEPALVCRWRLAGGKLPLENRHLRALGHRTVCGRPVSTQLIGWAKQHIEWTLKDGSVENPDGVLMLVMDAEGRAAMSVGPYAELAEKGVAVLAARAGLARREAAETGVAPETLFAVEGDALVCGLDEGGFAAEAGGAATLVVDLAGALGVDVRYDGGLAERVEAGEGSEDAFLASDEHGIVVAADAAGPQGARFAEGYAKLLAATRH